MLTLLDDTPDTSAGVLSRGISPAKFALLLALLIGAAFPDVLLGWGTFVHRDFGIFGYPLAYHHRASLWEGEIPLWNPYNHGGLPFLAQWNTMVFYPLSLFYAVLPLSWALGVFCLLHLWLAGLGMYFLVRHWTRHPWAASFAGLAFAFSGLLLSSLKWPNNMAALAWMPWVVAWGEKAFQNGGRAIVWASLLAALQMLSGGPEIILFTWLIVGALLAGQLLNSVVSRRGTGKWHRSLFSDRESAQSPDQDNGRPISRAISAPLIRLALVIFLTAGLAAAQLLPFFDLLLHSQRDASFSDSSWSMPPWGLANFFVPLLGCFPSHQGVYAQFGQYWVSSYYVSITAMALAIFALVKSRNIKVWVLASLGIACIWLALGSSGKLYAALRELIPQIQIIRFPIKFIVPVVFLLPLLAGIGVARAFPSDPNRPNTPAGLWAILPGFLILFTLLILGWARLFPIAETAMATTLKSGLRTILCLIMLAIVLRKLGQPLARKSRELWALLLLLLVWLDANTHAPRLAPAVERWIYEANLAQSELRLQPAPGLGTSRVLVSPYADFRLNHLSLTNAVEDFLYSRLSLFANVNLLDRIPKVDGFFSLNLKEEFQIRSLLYSRTNAWFPNLNAFLGVSHVSSDAKPIEWSTQSRFSTWVTAGQAPLFLKESAMLDRMAAGDLDFNQWVLLPEEAALSSSATNRVAALATIERMEPHQVEVEVDADRAAWVVFAQSYYHPWRATVNGQAARLWRANHAFQAVEVPAGKSRVGLKYVDRAFQCGAGISLGAILLSFLIWRRPVLNGRP